MRIDHGQFKICVYAGEHPPPHCHVRWNDGQEATVALPTLEVIVGRGINKSVRQALLESMDDLCDAYETLNPGKHEDES